MKNLLNAFSGILFVLVAAGPAIGQDHLLEDPGLFWDSATIAKLGIRSVKGYRQAYQEGPDSTPGMLRLWVEFGENGKVEKVTRYRDDGSIYRETYYLDGNPDHEHIHGAGSPKPLLIRFRLERDALGWPWKLYTYGEKKKKPILYWERSYHEDGELEEIIKTMGRKIQHVDRFEWQGDVLVCRRSRGQRLFMTLRYRYEEGRPVHFSSGADLSGMGRGTSFVYDENGLLERQEGSAVEFPSLWFRFEQ